MQVTTYYNIVDNVNGMAIFSLHQTNIYLIRHPLSYNNMLG